MGWWFNPHQNGRHCRLFVSDWLSTVCAPQDGGDDDDDDDGDDDDNDSGL